MVESLSEPASLGPLRIAVCIKQVPLLSALRFDPATRRIVREGVPLEINELDIYAITEAIRLRNIHGGEVIVVTMGPPQAREALATALAMGADKAFHLNDRAFAGADTAATARALAMALQHLDTSSQQEIDLIICGRHSIDAETAQVGPEIAEMLHLPQISAVQQLDLQLQNGRRALRARRELDEGSELLSVPLPALVTTAEGINEGIWPDEHEIRRASEQAGERIQTITAADLQFTQSASFGQAGSPTWVAAIEADTQQRAGRIIAESEPAKTVEVLIAALREQGLLTKPTKGPAISQKKTQIPSALLQPREAIHSDRAVWVIAEHAQQKATGKDQIRRTTLELLGKGLELAATLHGELATVLLGGPGVAEQAATLAAYGAERIYLIEDPALADYTTEGYTAAIAEAIQRYQPAVVLMGSTANGRDLAPRVAARLGLGLTGDCIDLGIDEQQRLIQYKPAFGGSIVSSILSNTTPAMATLRPGMLTSAEPDFTREPRIEAVVVEGIAEQIHTHILEHTDEDTGVADLEAAHTVLGVGRGLGEPEHYQTLYQLASLLDAAIGATRAVTDQGWLPRQKQIGLTGRAISPQLYLALGIRGASEHLAGIRKAGFIVSINKNKRAAIFRHSDIGVVGDVHVLLPLLVEQLRAIEGKEP
ncbi:electron transfer flavoprotein alpha/ beta subunit [Ktedonosporobacter rubrisoli]|uniref:Electron transfer flavoprotein small subunit n=1 Tax=Ktedonosporobacter rubrisoli TaxID=2509675 RepID=A0A4P6K261_KTERU|nr:FAD-binding protein [Ktedonosporobacter rubrisoli]QBD82214.1 electron transfer flavoprotein alpha/ beta subunit [Ktedonosporobacter rubrisoli]